MCSLFGGREVVCLGPHIVCTAVKAECPGVVFELVKWGAEVPYLIDYKARVQLGE